MTPATAQVNATLLLRNLPPHLRNLVVTRTHGRAAPGSSAAAAKAALLRQAQAGPAPQVRAPLSLI